MPILWTPSESLALAPFWCQYSGLPLNPWPQHQMYKKWAIFFHFCSATIRTLKLGDRVLLIIQAENVAINSDIVGSFTFVKSFKEILASFLYTRQCNSVLLGLITDIPMHFPIEMTCYRGIRRSVVRSNVHKCKLVLRAHTTVPPKACMTDNCFMSFNFYLRVQDTCSCTCTQYSTFQLQCTWPEWESFGHAWLLSEIH